jgi:hypothetical protein
MATLRSSTDWTGRDINGVILGEPVVDEVTGEFLWDHPAIPGDYIDLDGDIFMEVPVA